MSTKWQQWLLVAILTGLSSLYLTATVSAQPDQLQWSERSIKVWDNGPKVQSQLNRNGSLQINTSTQGLQKGYYSAYVYELQNRDWSGYSELRFSIRSDSDQTLPLNVVITRTDQSALTVADQRNVILIPKATKEPKLVHPVDGLIRLEPGFEGEVRVPFSSLMVRNHAATVGLVTPGKMLSWGITMTTTENAQLNYRVGNIKLVPRKEATAENQLSSVMIKGDERVVKPVAGESVETYTVIGLQPTESKASEMPEVNFQLAHPVQGVTITTGGLLTIGTDAAKADSVTIRALVDQKWNLDYTVKLDRSTAMQMKEADGTPRFIPSPGQVPKVLEPSNVWLQPWMEWIIRIGLLLIGLMVVIPYWLWRKLQHGSQAGKQRSMNHRRSKRLFKM
ncbi:hypothetical protein EC604_15020 [Paenibacillus amylolyticus]|uniref:DUF916 domain-containing protein n=1 Tax=Paenibacillus amylolyticus TaxID=1451 RepID=A0A5M9WU73_PAEAM|nr:hypothetical protein [Paenibacillus amylolyticus]KAA8785155.1 hypothetical protein EC604_15020 [Paenibacillus amylolyticus]